MQMIDSMLIVLQLERKKSTVKAEVMLVWWAVSGVWHSVSDQKVKKSLLRMERRLISFWTESRQYSGSGQTLES